MINNSRFCFMHTMSYMTMLSVFQHQEAMFARLCSCHFRRGLSFRRVTLCMFCWAQVNASEPSLTC